MKFRTKLLCVMKLTTALILFTAMHVYAKTSGQVITYSARNAKLEQVFRALEQQTGYGFFYQVSDLKNARPVSVELKNLAFPAALKMILKNQGLDFVIDGKTVFITPKKKEISTIGDLNPGLLAPPIDVKGVVRDESGKPAAGVSVMIKGTTRGTSTNERGEFSLNAVPENATLVFSSINMETYETNLNGRVEVTLVMKAKVSQLQEVEITAVNTGYQTIPKERATGSFVHVDNALLNRSVSTNILDRINGVTSGVLFTPGLTPGTVSSDNKAAISIRGRSTIYSNPNPLIILDNFPYDGDLSTINPNDVESIDILKDAAAASIWGAYSGNGVIVITTKKGKLNQQMKVSLNTNVTIGEKPNLYYVPTLNSSDYVSVEQFLYNNGGFTSSLTNASLAALPISAVALILNKQKLGQITASQTADQLDALRNQDYRTDLNKYFYRTMVNQQYAVNLTGGGQSNQYFFSAGFDNNLPNLTYNSYQRITLNGNNVFFLIKDRVSLTSGITYSQSTTYNNNSGFASNEPYLQLADVNGNAIGVGTKYRQPYIDTAGKGKLLDWNYRPLDDIRQANNNVRLTNYNINLGLKYKIVNGLDLNLLYQYSNGESVGQNYYSIETFRSRDLINTYSQINYTTGAVVNNIPKGGIVDFVNLNYNSKQFRAISTFNHNWNGNHDLTAIGGFEIKSYNSQTRTYRLYGYDADLQTFAPVDFLGRFPQYSPSGGSAAIPNNVTNLGKTNNYVSYFTNAAYTYKGKYSLSASAREDGSNIFGVNTNQKNIPLWSIGAKWSINKEAFYHLAWLPSLRLRVTYGYNANSNNSTSALVTATYSSSLSQWGTPIAYLQNPPNPSLRWEKINMLNIGLDFGLKNDILSGSIEYYQKKGTDILGNAPISPQTGVSQFFRNITDMKGHGLDMTLTSKNLIGRNFEWQTNFLFSYQTDIVTNYKIKPSNLASFITQTNGSFLTVTPLEGMPLYSIFSYMWAGLDPATGNPKFYLNDKVSTDYSALSSSNDYDNLHYNGPAIPVYFGSLRNAFRWKEFSFSFNITYKLGYWFRNPFVTRASSAYLTSSPGLIFQDYLQRWQKPGDEAMTNVPSMSYPISTAASEGIYVNSDITAFKADHVRLQDIQLSYDFPKKRIGKLLVPSLRFYVYLNNLGILWKANNMNIDPDATSVTSMPNPKTYSLGVKVDF